MAVTTVHQMAVKMTVEQNDAIAGFNQYERRIRELLKVKNGLEAAQADTSAIDDEIQGLRKLQMELAQTGGLTKNVGTSTKKMSQNMNAATKGSGKFSQAIGQAAFGVEDFFAGFETGGLKGGLRGAGNNMSMVARIAAGPLTGGLVGIALVSLPLVIKALSGAEEKTDDFAKALDNLVDAQQRKVDAFNADVDHDKRIKDIQKEGKSVEDLKGQLEDLLLQRKKDKNELAAIAAVRAKLGEKAGISDKDFGIAGSQQAIFGKIDTALGAWKPGGMSEFNSNVSKELKQNLQAAMSNAVEQLKKRPEHAETIGKVLGGDINRAFDAAQDKVESEGKFGSSMLLGKIQGGTLWNSYIDDVKDVVNEEGKLAGIAEKATTLNQKSNDLKKEGVRSLEEEKALRNAITKAQKEENKEASEKFGKMKKEQEAALQTLQQAGQSPFQQMIQKMIDERQKLRDAFAETDKGVSKQVLIKAERKSLEASLAKLEKELAKNTQVLSKGEHLLGPNRAESAELARIKAKTQIDKAEVDKDKNKDVVDAINLLKEVLAGKTVLAVPSP